jgi:hypothetical protein
LINNVCGKKRGKTLFLRMLKRLILQTALVHLL